MSVCSHVDRFSIKLTLSPPAEMWHDNCIIMATVTSATQNLHHYVVVDHGHRRSSGESFVSIVIKALPATNVSTVQFPEKQAEPNEFGDVCGSSRISSTEAECMVGEVGSSGLDDRLSAVVAEACAAIATNVSERLKKGTSEVQRRRSQIEELDGMMQAVPVSALDSCEVRAIGAQLSQMTDEQNILENDLAAGASKIIREQIADFGIELESRLGAEACKAVAMGVFQPGSRCLEICLRLTG